MRQVISGHVAVQRWKDRCDPLALLLFDPVERAINLAHLVRSLFQGMERLGVRRPEPPVLAAGEDGAQAQHMIAGLAVKTGTLATGIGIDHPADSGAIGCRKLRREKQPIGLQRPIELVLDHAGLDPNPAQLRIDLQDPRHMPRTIDHHASRQGLPVRPRSPAAQGYRHLPKLRLIQHARQDRQIGGATRKHDTAGEKLINGIVRGIGRPAPVPKLDLPRKPGLHKPPEKTWLGEHCVDLAFQTGNHGDHPE